MLCRKRNNIIIKRIAESALVIRNSFFTSTILLITIIIRRINTGNFISNTIFEFLFVCWQFHSECRNNFCFIIRVQYAFCHFPFGQNDARYGRFKVDYKTKVKGKKNT